MSKMTKNTGEDNSAGDPHAVAVRIHLQMAEEHPREEHIVLQVGKQAALLDLMQRGAERFRVEILPGPTTPLDTLHHLKEPGHEIGPAITDLDSTLEEFLARPDATPDFVIRLELVFRVNTRWAISPAAEQTPRQILLLPAIGLNPTEFSLYESESNEVLPPDKPVRIAHGTVFESQKDGKYGELR